jgi:hypothetical protein
MEKQEKADLEKGESEVMDGLWVRSYAGGFIKSHRTSHPELVSGSKKPLKYIDSETSSE